MRREITTGVYMDAGSAPPAPGGEITITGGSSNINANPQLWRNEEHEQLQRQN